VSAAAGHDKKQPADYIIFLFHKKHKTPERGFHARLYGSRFQRSQWYLSI